MFDFDPISLLLRTLLRCCLTLFLRGINHKSAVESLNSTIKQAGGIGNRDPPTQETEELRSKTEKAEKALRKYSHVRCWNRCCVPCFQYMLHKENNSLERFLELTLLALIHRELVGFRSNSNSDLTRHNVVGSAATFNFYSIADDERFFQETTVELEGQRAFMEELKVELMRDGGDQIFNLTGLAGTGKTTIAKRLCRDVQLKRKFNENIGFVGLDLEIQSIKHVAKKLVDKLRGIGNTRVLLVLDDVQRGSSEELVRLCRQEISSDSKILLISRDTLTGLGTPRRMRAVGNEKDKKALFRHFVRPIGTTSTSYHIPDHIDSKIEADVVRGCGDVPLVLKLIASELRGKPIEYWQQLLNKWSQHGVLETNLELLTYLQKSLIVLEEYKSIKEFFMDLALFPNKVIPVPAFIDMWIELYDQDEHGIDAMTFIHQLTDMNLADMVVEREVGSNADNYYNYHFLTQHDILKDLAIYLSKHETFENTGNEETFENTGNEETFENRRRLIIELLGNDRPEWCPSPRRLIGSMSKPQRVAARIVSISTDQKVTPDWCNIEAKKAKVLVLNLQTEEFMLPKFMKGMTNLKVFILTHYGLDPCKLENLELLNFLSSLKRIRLEKISVPPLCKLKNLRKISFYKCIVMLALNSSIEISKAMPNLVELDIGSCEDLLKLPAGLCEIRTLKMLSISNCGSFLELPNEIGNLKNLEVLRVSYCPDFEEMPESMTTLERLSLLDVSYCVSLRAVPEEFRKLRNLRKLYVMGTFIRKFPESVEEMKSLNVVICNEFTYDFWEDIRCHFLPHLEIKKATTMSFTDSVGEDQWLP